MRAKSEPIQDTPPTPDARAVVRAGSNSHAQSVAVTLFDSAGFILQQNDAARAVFAGPASGTNAFIAHLVHKDQAAQIWRQLLSGIPHSVEALVHTAGGLRRHHLDVSSTGTAVILAEYAVDQGVSAALATEGHERRFRDFAQAASDWFWETDSEFRFTYMSDNIYAASAALSREFVGKRLTDLRAGNLDRVDWAPLLDVVAQRKPFRDFRFQRRTDNGSLRHLTVSGVPTYDAEGAFLGYRGIGRDITQAVAAEARASAAQRRLGDALESIPDALLLIDAEDRIVLCNSRYRALHHEIEDMLMPGVAFSDVVAAFSVRLHPNDPAAAEAWRRQRIRRHGLFDSWIIRRPHNGRWYHISERPTAEGGTVLMQIDITDLKRREQEFAEKTQLLQATLDNMQQGLLVLDADLCVKAWNYRLLQLLDVEPDVVETGKPVIELFRAIGNRGEYGAGDIETLIRGRMEQLRKLDPPIRERRRPDGTVMEQRRVRMPDGGILITYNDITETRRVERDLRRAKDEAELASRSKTEFLANMSHEFRTPLNAIIGFSDVLVGQLFGTLGDARYADYARDIRDSGLHLLNLINDVLDVAKIEFGKVEITDETVDFGAVVDSCVRLMRERAETAGVKLRVELAPELPALRGDSRRLKQILINLLSNSVKFTPGGGSITISATADPRGFRVCVSDTGIGIAPEDLETALSPFGQIDSRLARKYQGTGLGLPLTKAMTELHGGTLELRSSPGQGTAATVFLPATRILGPGEIS
ncbi:MAG TPA: PAS-domain containing protein [Stellaceae bacterium]|nr:PAS-domain containing protein [Stellaceae bacterium]